MTLIIGTPCFRAPMTQPNSLSLSDVGFSDTVAPVTEVFGLEEGEAHASPKGEEREGSMLGEYRCPKVVVSKLTQQSRF